MPGLEGPKVPRFKTAGRGRHVIVRTLGEGGLGAGGEGLGGCRGAGGGGGMNLLVVLPASVVSEKLNKHNNPHLG